MFAAEKAKAQTKASDSPTRKVVHQSSTLVARPSDGGAVEQAWMPQAKGPAERHEQEAVPENLTAREAPRGPSWDFSKIPIFPPNRPNGRQSGRTKLTVGRADDPLEHEADRVADQVMRMPKPNISIAAGLPQISRKFAPWEEEAQTARVTLAEAPAIVHEVVRSPGHPLSAATRAYFEPRFGRDFSQVRVHSDARAAESARRVDAIAYAVNQDVVFGTGQYRPDSASGRHLLAHELAHTVQQRNASEQAPGLYRKAGGAASPTASASTAMTEAEFERIMKQRYGTTEIRTGTEVEQTAEVASRIRPSPPAITLPGWKSWNPGANSQVYELILESLEDFQSSIGGVPEIHKIIFYNTEYELSPNSVGVQAPSANPDAGASFGAGQLTIYRAFTIRNKALPIARSNPQGNYPPVVIGVTGTTGQTPGAPLPLPAQEESSRRMLTHELGHGLAEAAHSVEPGLFNDYKREVGWVATQLFDIGQPVVQTAIANGSPPPAQFEITINNWNSPQWVEQPVSGYMVSGGPAEDFAEAVMTFVREPNLLLSRSPRRFRFLSDRKDRWQPALLRVPQMGDFPLPQGADRAV
jgi:hypothetical protein